MLDVLNISEGDTRLLVPADSLRDAAPPRHPAFFNPRARRTRDLAVLAAGAHAPSRSGAYLDAMAGVGSRGLRVAIETRLYDAVYLNDSNPYAADLARRSAALNGFDAAHISTMDACRFLAMHSARGERGAAVDIDPFGSPAPYLDCALRALSYGGMLAVTATDLQVLGGLHDAACRRIYGGVPLKTEYHAETAIRLVLGCMAAVAGRLGLGTFPLYSESHMHYYRVYVRLLPKPGLPQIGYIRHCFACGQRGISQKCCGTCVLCGGQIRAAGPLWIGPLFNAEFVEKMIERDQMGDGLYVMHLEKCRREAAMPPGFYTLDQVASQIRTGPPSLHKMIGRLRLEGFSAEATSFSPTGFRTDASYAEVCRSMSAAKSHARQI